MNAKAASLKINIPLNNKNKTLNNRKHTITKKHRIFFHLLQLFDFRNSREHSPFEQAHSSLKTFAFYSQVAICQNIFNLLGASREPMQKPFHETNSRNPDDTYFNAKDPLQLRNLLTRRSIITA